MSASTQIQEKLCKITEYEWDKKPIGKGAYGAVYKGKHKKSGIEVAIKMLDESKIQDSDDKLHFYREFTYIHSIDHPYCIRLVNFCFDPPAIITPYMDSGSLDDFLQNKNKKTLTPTQKMCTIYSICSTMDAIHFSNFIHRDFKPANVLMKQNGKYIDPYIADFGSARDANSKGQLTECPNGTPLHIAPECCESENYTNLIDVFSFGITYLQFFNYNIVEYDNGSKVKRKILPIINEIKNGSRYKKPDNMSKEQYDIYLQCTNLNDNDRPTFQELADMFEKTTDIWFKGVVEKDYLDYVAQCKKVCHDYKEKQKKKKPKKRKISSLSSLASLASSSS